MDEAAAKAAGAEGVIRPAKNACQVVIKGVCRLCTMPCASSCNEEAVFLRKQLLEHRRERAAAPGPAVFLSERNFDMKPQTFTWKKLTADELTRVYLDEMRRDFPPSELKPLSMILNSEAAGMAHTWGVFEGETLVSYLLMVQPMGCEVSQLDYFSVLPAYRSTGIGARLLAALPAHEEGAKAILIEAECPEKADDEAMAVRRLGFYARCGAVDTGWTEHLFDAWFQVLVLPAEGETLDARDGQQRAGRLLQPGDGRGQVAQICPALPPGRHGREILIRS